jgi:hypothetical protein
VAQTRPTVNTKRLKKKTFSRGEKTPKKKNSSRSRGGKEAEGQTSREEALASGTRHGGDSPELRRRRREAHVSIAILFVRTSPEALQGESAPRGSKNLASPFPDLTCRLTDLNRGPDQAESSGSPTASAPGRAEEDSVAGAAPARSAGSVDDAAAVAQKGGAAFGRFGGPMVW